AVQTAVGVGADLVGRGTHDENRLIADRVLDVRAGLGDLLLAAGHLPHARPEPLHLEIEELARDVTVLGDEPVSANEQVGAHIAHSPTVAGFNLADLFERVADTVPDREAVVCGERRLTYRELDERATRLANG